MTTLKKGVKITLIVAILVSFFTPQVVLGQMEELNKVADDTGLKGDTNLVEIIGNLISTVLGLIGIILLVLFIYAGFLWMTAGGDKDQVEKAKSIFKNAVIGLVIIVFSYFISGFIIDKLSSVSGTQPSQSQEQPSGGE